MPASAGGWREATTPGRDLLAVMEGADPAKTAVLCLFHDTQETRIGDVPSVGKAYVVTAPNPEVTTDQVAGFPAEAGQAVRGLVEEYEGP